MSREMLSWRYRTARSGRICAVVLTAATVAALIYCGIVHQPLIAEHRMMNEYAGNSFWVMTVGCYIGAGVTLITGLALIFGTSRMVHRLAQVALAGIIVAMGTMIGAYFYVHYSTTLPLPWGIDHEGPEHAGTVSVITESCVIILSAALGSITLQQRNHLGRPLHSRAPAGTVSAR